MHDQLLCMKCWLLILEALCLHVWIKVTHHSTFILHQSSCPSTTVLLPTFKAHSPFAIKTSITRECWCSKLTRQKILGVESEEISKVKLSTLARSVTSNLWIYEWYLKITQDLSQLTDLNLSSVYTTEFVIFSHNKNKIWKDCMWYVQDSPTIFFYTTFSSGQPYHLSRVMGLDLFSADATRSWLSTYGQPKNQDSYPHNRN